MQHRSLAESTRFSTTTSNLAAARTFAGFSCWSQNGLRVVWPYTLREGTPSLCEKTLVTVNLELVLKDTKLQLSNRFPARERVIEQKARVKGMIDHLWYVRKETKTKRPWILILTPVVSVVAKSNRTAYLIPAILSSPALHANTAVTGMRNITGD